MRAPTIVAAQLAVPLALLALWQISGDARR